MIEFTNLGYGMLALGVILFIAVIAVRNQNGVHKDVKWVVGIAAAALILSPIFVPQLQAPTQQVVSTGQAPSISFTGLSGVTFVSSTNTLKVVVTYNSTANTIKTPTSGVVKFDAVVNSLQTADTFPSVILAANPAISNSTAASDNSYLFTQYTGNSTMEATVALPNGVSHVDVPSAGVSYLFPLKSASTAQVNFTFTLSAQGIANLNGNNGIGAQQDYTIQIAGQTYTLEVLLTSVIS